MAVNLGMIISVLKDPKRRVWVIMAIGVLGMMLIFFSRDAAPVQASVSEPVDVVSTRQTIAEEHALHLERRLTELISQIDGVGRVVVMVTVQDSGEYVYAREERRNTDAERHSETAQGLSGRVLERESFEDRYVMVESADGRRQALVRTRLEPRVQGVVVLIEGADDVRVQARVINVVTTALNISSARVSVERIVSLIEQEESQ